MGLEVNACINQNPERCVFSGVCDYIECDYVSWVSWDFGEGWGWGACLWMLYVLFCSPLLFLSSLCVLFLSSGTLFLCQAFSFTLLFQVKSAAYWFIVLFFPLPTCFDGNVTPRPQTHIYTVLPSFDPRYQVRLMFFFSLGTPVFPVIPWDVWDWIFALPFPRTDLT